MVFLQSYRNPKISCLGGAGQTVACYLLYDEVKSLDYLVMLFIISVDQNRVSEINSQNFQITFILKGNCQAGRVSKPNSSIWEAEAEISLLNYSLGYIMEFQINLSHIAR